MDVQPYVPTQMVSVAQDTIVFVILIAFLLFRPHGVLGKRPQKANV